jgi:hypothetical protein
MKKIILDFIKYLFEKYPIEAWFIAIIVGLAMFGHVYLLYKLF